MTACSACNNKKGDNKTLENALVSRCCGNPERPKWLPNRELELQDNRMPSTWLPYLVAASGNRDPRYFRIQKKSRFMQATLFGRRGMDRF